MDNKNDYRDFSAEDFLLDESFQRFCLGADAGAERFWNKWLLEHPHRQAEAFKAKELYFILNGGNSSESFKAHGAAFHDRLMEEGIIAGENEEKVPDMPLPGKPRRTISLYKLVAAAVLLIAVSLSIYFILGEKKPQNDMATTGTEKEVDIEPGGDKAILMLADGRKIVLDTAANGSLTEQGGVKVIKIGGQISYAKGSGAVKEVLYNTIATPKGGQYQLELADGSKVWLNAASSLRFPTEFTGKNRVVELTGEGYFEIAHNPQAPFHVKVNDMDVQVLGTHFNINSYSDEPAVATTLLEGKVRVTKGANNLNLHPGQQAIILQGTNSIRMEDKVNVEEVVAWKNGLIYFDGADVSAVMRQIARWYDVEVEYSGNVGAVHLSGRVSRNLNLSQLIAILEELGIDIHREGKKLVATPKP